MLVAAMGAVTAWLGPAKAQSGPPADASQAAQDPGILPPKALHADAPYPAGAEGDAEVELELLVGADGSVSAVRSLAGPEPFASAAVSEARSWRFEPAQRGGRAVAARIRFRVRYVEEKVPVAPSRDDAEPTTPDGPSSEAPAPPREAVEVLIQGERVPGDVASMTRTEVQQLPGAFGDPFRAIEVLPGVAPVVSGVPYFYLRGAPPGNVGYFIDGVRVPQLFHAFIGPGVLHPAMVERVDLFRGAYPARYGRYAGGVVAAETKPLSRSWHGEGNVRLIDAGALVEAPLGRRGGVMLGGRYSYTGLVISAVTPGTRLGYWDYQVLTEYELGPADRVGMLAFGSFDYLRAEESDYNGSTRFHRLDLRYDHDLDARTHARLAFTLGEDRLGDESASVRDRMIGGRFELSREVDQRLLLRLGSDFSWDHYELEVPSAHPQFDVADVEELFPSRSEVVWGGYAEAVWRPQAGVAVTPGIRFDQFRSAGETAIGVDPRVSARFDVSRRVAITHSLGLAHQSASFIPGAPATQVSSLRGGLQKSVQASSGVELELPEDLSLSLVAFDSIFLNFSDPLGVSRELTLDPSLVDLRAQGSAYGLEVFLRRSLTRRVGGLLSYTLSRSERSRDEVSSVAAFDRTHVGNLALSVDLGKRWRAGTRVFAMSGVPTQRLGSSGPRFISERGPAYYRVDLRLEKRWRLAKTGYLGFVAEMLNATATRQVTARSCTPCGCRDEAVGPLFLPSVGVEAGF